MLEPRSSKIQQIIVCYRKFFKKFISSYQKEKLLCHLNLIICTAPYLTIKYLKYGLIKLILLQSFWPPFMMIQQKSQSLQRLGQFGIWLPKRLLDLCIFLPIRFSNFSTLSFARKNQIAIDVLGFSLKFFNYVDSEIYIFLIDFIYSRKMEPIYMVCIQRDADLTQIKAYQKISCQAKLYFRRLSFILYLLQTVNLIPMNIQCLYTKQIYLLYKSLGLRAGVLSTTGHSTNFIRAIDCPTKKNPDYWIFNGAAFTTQLND